MLQNIVLLFFLFIQSFSQNHYSEDGNRDGPWQGYYETGELRYEGVFKEGKETGVFKYYYKSGNLEKELLYIEDGVRAKVKMYYSNKNIKTLGEYCLKNRCGTWEYFDDLGNIIIRENYKNGILNGAYFVFFDGVLNEICNYENGKKNGVSKTFFKTGQIQIIKNYLNDKLHGKYELFNKEGELVEMLNYSNGFLD